MMSSSGNQFSGFKYSGGKNRMAGDYLKDFSERYTDKTDFTKSQSKDYRGNVKNNNVSSFLGNNTNIDTTTPTKSQEKTGSETTKETNLSQGENKGYNSSKQINTGKQQPAHFPGLVMPDGGHALIGANFQAFVSAAHSRWKDEGNVSSYD